MIDNLKRKTEFEIYLDYKQLTLKSMDKSRKDKLLKVC